jgi:predicted DNA-binding transcriptional regulator YafY
METLLRQWAMLRLIPRHPRKIDTAALKKGLENLGYEINLRSIQRDLNKLSIVLPLVSDQGKPQGWWWNADAGLLDLPGLEPQSALVFKMAEQHLSRIMPSSTMQTLAPWFKAADGVLVNTSNHAGKWVNKVRIISKGQPLLPPVVNTKVQSLVYQALFDGKKLSISYLAHRAPEAHIFIVNAIALVQRDQHIYLVCTLGASEQIKLLVMHRIQSAHLLETPSMTPAGFDLDVYIAEGGLGYQVGKPINLVAEVSDSVASILAETPLSLDQSLSDLETGKIHLTASVANTKELRSWLRGFGRHIRVLSPHDLLVRRQSAWHGQRMST